MSSADEIVGLTDLFFSDFPELTAEEKEVMAGETVPTVLNALKEKLEAMTDEDFQPDNIFPQIKAVQKKQASRAKTSSCQSVSLFQAKCMDLSCQILFTCSAVKNPSSILTIC